MIENRSNKGFFADIFKKGQISTGVGVREIIILIFLEKILVKITETMSHTICVPIESEMLSKPNEKLERSKKHIIKVDSFLSESKTSISLSNSLDATKWCNLFLMNAFSCFLVNLLPKKYHHFISRVMNCISNKSILIPEKLITKLKGKNGYKTFRKQGMLRLYKEYNKPTKNRYLLKKCGDDRMINITNMMQGIAHKTSSLIHSAYLCLIEVSMHKSFNKEKINLGIVDKCDLITTFRCSSDDSSYVFTIVFEKSLPLWKKHYLNNFMRKFSKIFKLSYAFWCAKLSKTKSTFYISNNVEEFNSVWRVSNTVIMSLIKFILPCFKLPVTIRLVDKMRYFSSSISQAIENGLSIETATLINRAQSDINYLGMGSSSSTTDFDSRFRDDGII